MRDFITLACPVCGGKLDISPDIATLRCQFCGNEHIIRREAGNVLLEIYNRCPVCKRNDQVKKVSGIVSAQTKNIKGVTIEKSEYTDEDGSSYTTFPEKNTEGAALISFCASLFCIGALVWGLAKIVGLPSAKRLNNKQKMLQKEEEERVLRLIPDWQRAVRKWEHPYYCERVDVMFDPRTNTYATADAKDDYLFQSKGGTA